MLVLSCMVWLHYILRVFLYSLGVSSYIYVVLSAVKKTFGEYFTLWCLLCLVLKYSYSISEFYRLFKSVKSFSKRSSSFIWCGEIFHSKPHVSFLSFLLSQLMWKWAFQRMLFITFVIFSINFDLQNDADGTGTLFKE